MYVRSLGSRTQNEALPSRRKARDPAKGEQQRQRSLVQLHIIEKRASLVAVASPEWRCLVGARRDEGMRMRLPASVVLIATLLCSVAAPAFAQSAVPDTVRSSTLTRTQEAELSRRLATLQQRFSTLARETDLREVAVRNIAVEIFGARPDLDFETYVALIESGARELRTYITDARGRSETDPVLAELRAGAIDAAEGGRLTDARALYDQLIARSTEGLDARWAREDAQRERQRDAERLSVATDMAEAARLAFVAADYRDAAIRYARAAEGAPESARDQRWEWRTNQGLALYEQGLRFETAALVEAQQVVEREAWPLVPRATDAQGWAITQNNLGLVLQALGQRQGGPEGLATLAASRAAYERALEVSTRATNAQGWAMTQTNLGSVSAVSTHETDRLS